MGALIHYIESLQGIFFTNHSVRFQFCSMEGTLMIGNIYSIILLIFFWYQYHKDQLMFFHGDSIQYLSI